MAAIDALRLTPGERVLDVGCGIGGTPLQLGDAVGPDGTVLGLELIPSAVEVARSTLNLPQNVAFACGDAETHPFEQGSFDAVFSRFGVMFFANPLSAFRNIRTGLRVGGRLAFTCWRGLEENELDSFPLRAAASVLPQELVEQTSDAAWFSFSDPEYVRALLEAAGFIHVDVTPHERMVGSGSLQAMVSVCTRVGALGAILREHPDLAPQATAALERARSLTGKDLAALNSERLFGSCRQWWTDDPCR